MTDLILTNGDVAADLLAGAGREGAIVPWRDVLHEGPLAPAASLEAFSEARAAYLAARFRLDPIALREDFRQRDGLVRRHADFDRVEIWLEHDLYDQLQLLQMLSFFSGQGRTAGLFLVQADEFLGHQRPDSILRFGSRARQVDQVMLDLAAQIWNELASPSPAGVLRRVQSTSGILTYLFPHMEAALLRFLADLPAPRSGLSHTESVVLGQLGAGPQTIGALFRQLIAAEPAPFMGDLSFFRILADLANCARPLVTMTDVRAGPAGRNPADEEVRLTDHGRSVIAGRSDHVTLNGIDRWWAGTHLTERNCWRFDRSLLRLEPPRRSSAGGDS